MRIQFFILGAVVALATGIGFASADEFSVANTAVNTGKPFAMLDGIETSQMSVQEMEATRGADRIPQSPGITLQPRLIATIQPSGATHGVLSPGDDLTYTVLVTN